MNCASCGHDRETHLHYRATAAPQECSICLCPAFAAPLWRLLLDAIQRRYRRA